MTKRKYRSGPARFPGITQAARHLKISRTHLYLVLVGKRHSAGLRARYESLLAPRAA